MTYGSSIEIRKVDVMGETDWHWPIGDVYCFGEGDFATTGTGPAADWIQDFHIKYFEHLRENNVVITAGAACGMYARFYAKKFKHVYAFEPDPLNFHCLVNNTQNDNVVKINAALSDINGITGFKRSAVDNVGTGSVVAPNDFLIPTLTIDTFHFHACDLIQLDAEGYEGNILVGARYTINRYKPVIISERFDEDNHKEFMLNLFNYRYIETSHMDAIYLPN